MFVVSDLPGKETEIWPEDKENELMKYSGYLFRVYFILHYLLILTGNVLLLYISIFTKNNIFTTAFFKNLLYFQPSNQTTASL